jgi:hypothetical protein
MDAKKYSKLKTEKKFSKPIAIFAKAFLTATVARRKRNERKENFCETSVFLTTKGYKVGTKDHKVIFFIFQSLNLRISPRFSVSSPWFSVVEMGSKCC